MDGTVLVKYNGNAANVIIPSGVTAIGDFAFHECNRLASITIGANVMIDEVNIETFHYNFTSFYDEQGRKAGTYTYRNGSWSVR